MGRSLVVVLLVVSAFWQMLAVGGRPGGLSTPREAAHALLHWQGQAHHHHDDGSVTLDGSEESVQHVALDGVLAVNSPWSEPAVSLPPAASAYSTAADEVSGPWPYLDGPRRPPKLPA
jgi:hypothetical protein